MMSKLTLLLLFSFSLLNLQAQDWELIYQENFGTGYTGQPLPQDWESNIFNGSTLGATGGADDPCQSSLLRFYSAYLAYQMNLSDTYEYYVSMNVKTDDPAGAELIFYHNTIAEASGTVIGAPATVPTIPSNQPGQVISSAIFSDLDGAHYFVIAKGPNDPSGGDERTRIDDFKLYRRPVGGTNEIPTVTFTQPTDGTTFEENETVVIAATASDPDGTIQSVQFYEGQTLLAEDFTAPYETTIANGLAVGSYTLKAVATDNEGATAETTITVTVDPVDTGGGGNPSDWELIYEENFGTGYTGQPLPANWEDNIFNGSTQGATGGDDDPCRSSLLRFYSAYLAYQMDLSDTYEYYVSMNLKTDDPAGAELIFYHNTIAEASGTPIGDPVSVPTIPTNQPGQVMSSAIFGDLNGAHYFIIAKGPNDPSSGDERTRIDDFKLYRRLVGGTNEVPTVTFTQPTDGTTFEENETIAIAATASDPDGTIQSVQFYEGQTLLAEDFTAPYETAIANGLAVGSYTLKAIATDNEGATAETTITVTIDPTDTGGGGNPSDWELIYEENFGTGYTGQPLPANWEDNIFNGTTQGATGGDDDPCQSSLLRFYSAYLAYQMDLSDTYEYYVSMNLKTDDPAGAELIFYHNTEAEASGTTIGDPITVPTIPANQPGQVMSSAIFGDLNGAHYFIIAKGPNDPSSGDERTRIDDFKLYRRPVGGTNEVPTVTLTAPADGATFEENENIAISATASDPDGSIQSVQFYYDQTLINEVFSEPYQTALGVGLIAGTYTLRAVATDDGGATSEDQINITVNATPPVLPSIAFETSSLSVEEGASVEVCLSISEAPEQAVSMEVAVSGNASPHFDDYTTTTINFPTGSTSNQCFTLNTDPIDQVLSGEINYSFVLQTPVGSEIGTVNQLIVNVSDQSTQVLSTISFVTATASLTAGEDLQVCLSISEAPSESASVEVAISGNSAPHFSSFVTTTVHFPIGETRNQCFNLSSLLAPEVTESTNYTFVLQNPVAAELSTSNNLVLTVNPAATGVDCPYAGPDQTICAGETITIGCPGDPNDPSPYCFKWEPEIGFLEEFGSTQPNPTIQPEETTTYTLYVTDGNGSLIAEEELLIVVNSGGNLTITPESPIVCNGGGVVLDAGSGFESYLWSTGATTQIIEVTSEGPYGVTVTDDASNCIVTESIQVTKSDPSLTILPSNPILCEELIQIEAVGDFLDYVWMDEAGEVIGIDATVEITEPGQFQLFARDDLGCEIEKVFQVEPGITELTVSPSLAHLCLDGSLTLSVNQSFISYSWYNGNEELLGTGQDLTVYSTGSIRVEVTNTYGCTKGLEFIVEDAIASNVSISPANPSICYSDNPGLIDQNSRGTAKNDNDCQQQQVTLEAGAGYSSYIWSNNATTPTIVVDQLGTYAVTVVDENGCTGVAETIVKACTTEELVISPTPGHLIGTDPVTFTANLGFSTYTWSTGETSSSIDVSTPGTYTLSVTDEKGCMNSKTFTVQEISADAVVDLELYKPAVIAGNTTTVVQNEDGIGGMTYVNLDNDDRDRKLDNVDNVVSNDGIEGDNELMRLRLKLDPDGSQNRTVRLLAIEGGQFVRIWQGNDKHRNQEYILGDEIQLVEQDGDFWVSELWIEGILAHQSQRATVLQLLYNNSVDAQIFDEVSITVVGVKAMTWQGIGNGFVNANNVSSNDLDMNDPNFGDQRNADGTSMLNMRVFPAGRILSPILVSELRNSVNLAVELTVEPVEDCVLYLKVLDVDDPSSSHRMLDPNDRSRRPGFYRGTQVYTQQLNYEEHNDNRGLVDGCCKFGVLDGDDDRDGIIEMRFTTGTSLQSVGFRVSIFPGDNYRVAGFFDSAFADSWVNLDHRGHGLGIVDAFSNREIQLPSNYLSPVLTVWRLLHIEYDSMENLLDPQNDVMGFITDFHGARASRTRRVTQLITTNGNIIDLNDSPTNVDNLASLNLDYAGGKWKGRFENGQLTIGNSEPANQISVVGNGNQEVRLSRPLLNSTRNLTFMLQEGISMVTGQVSEIRKAGVNFEFTLMNLTGNLTPFTTGAVFSISNGQGMEIVDIDITNSRLIGRNLRIPFNLSDDDANQADGTLPYNFVNDNDGLLTGLDAYQRAYLECIPFQQNLHPNLAFQADAGLSQHFGIFIDANDSRILESQGDDDSVPNFGDRVWLAYLSTAFQTGFWRKDRDPDLEKEKDPTMDKLTGINLGITLTPRDVTSLIDDEILPGRQYSMIPFETFREEGANNFRARSIAHELGHQFGIPHYKGKSNLMNESLDQGNNGTFLPFQLNLIRSRKLSPGAGIE